MSTLDNAILAYKSVLSEALTNMHGSRPDNIGKIDLKKATFSYIDTKIFLKNLSSISGSRLFFTRLNNDIYCPYCEEHIEFNNDYTITPQAFKQEYQYVHDKDIDRFIDFNAYYKLRNDKITKFGYALECLDTPALFIGRFSFDKHWKIENAAAFFDLLEEAAAYYTSNINNIKYE